MTRFMLRPTVGAVYERPQCRNSTSWAVIFRAARYRACASQTAPTADPDFLCLAKFPVRWGVQMIKRTLVFISVAAFFAAVTVIAQGPQGPAQREAPAPNVSFDRILKANQEP